jgi:hypothetical protein
MLINEGEDMIDPRKAAEAGLLWTFDMVEERLIETMDLWRRSPGGGGWPFASDGPWHLVKAELYGPDVDKDAPLRPLPLRVAEVEQRDETSGWLLWIADESTRRLVVLAVTKLAKGHKQVPWKELLRPMGVRFGAHGLRKRYGRALSTICARLNGGFARSHVSTLEK